MTESDIQTRIDQAVAAALAQQQPRYLYPHPQPMYPQYQRHPQLIRVAHGQPIGVVERLFHYGMIIATFGLWLPIYLLRQRARGER